MYDNLQDAMDAEVTVEEARREVKKHGCEFADFLEDMGISMARAQAEGLSGADVLGWLGY